MSFASEIVKSYYCEARGLLVFNLTNPEIDMNYLVWVGAGFTPSRGVPKGCGVLSTVNVWCSLMYVKGENITPYNFLVSINPGSGKQERGP